MSRSPVPLNLSAEIRRAIIATLGPTTDRADMLRYARRAIEAQLAADGHPVNFPICPPTAAPGSLRALRGNLSPRLVARALGLSGARSLNTLEQRDRRGELLPETRARYLAAVAEIRAELALERQQERKRGEDGQHDC